MSSFVYFEKVGEVVLLFKSRVISLLIVANLLEIPIMPSISFDFVSLVPNENTLEPSWRVSSATITAHRLSCSFRSLNYKRLT